MENRPVINVRGLDCSPEVEEKFNTWLNKTHIPMLLKFKGMRRVASYKKMGDDEQFPKYLAIFEFEDSDAFEEYSKSPELAAAIEEMKVSWPASATCFESKWRVQYELVESWEK